MKQFQASSGRDQARFNQIFIGHLHRLLFSGPGSGSDQWIHRVIIRSNVRMKKKKRNKKNI